MLCEEVLRLNQRLASLLVFSSSRKESYMSDEDDDGRMFCTEVRVVCVVCMYVMCAVMCRRFPPVPNGSCFS